MLFARFFFFLLVDLKVKTQRPYAINSQQDPAVTSSAQQLSRVCVTPAHISWLSVIISSRSMLLITRQMGVLRKETEIL